MSVRPYRDIQRRICRQIHVGKVPVGGDAPITVQSMTNTVTSDVKATVEQVQALERRGRRHRPRVVSGPGIGAGPEGHRAPGDGADRRRHPFPLQARDRGGRERRRLPAHQPRQYRLGRARARGDQGGQGPRLLDAHRRQCRLARARPARKIWRALPRGHGRKRAEPRQDPRRQRFLRVQDFLQGVRRVPRRRRLSAAGRSLRLSAPSRHHRGRRAAQRHGQIVDRARHAAVVRHRRHDPGLAVGRSGRGGQGRLRHAEIAGPAPARGHGHLLPVLRAPAIRGDQDGRAARGAARPHHDAADACR